ncbi:hypothetical protein [Amycolatopsis arida]|uniref:hypothetical protein n=1 Tax=Amycolatopsis arida TaxID=587909 RepID=UPI000B828892|nr:hypothetical protein [Amycolatopsis arida]
MTSAHRAKNSSTGDSSSTGGCHRPDESPAAGHRSPRATARADGDQLLDGDTDEQRLAALDADDPTTLPWIAHHLDHLATAPSD